VVSWNEIASWVFIASWFFMVLLLRLLLLLFEGWESPCFKCPLPAWDKNPEPDEEDAGAPQ